MKKSTSIPHCKLHPITVRLMQKGHPWVIEDQFTKRFPNNAPLIQGIDQKGKSVGILLNDPTHKKIKARYWSNELSKNTLKQELIERLKESILRRRELDELSRRNIYYLCFGEVDQLPGLFIIRMNEHVLVQYYTLFWQKYLKDLAPFLCTELGVHKKNIWFQHRSEDYKGQRPAYNLDGDKKSHFQVQEYEANYHITLGELYDFGFYPDMSHIRSLIESYYPQEGTLLNLFSYTGAFSVHALTNGVKSATSVDLSHEYLATLKENIRLNNINENRSHVIESSVEEFFKKNNEQFDMIVCDPPSSFYNGKTRVSVQKFYQDQMLKMDEALKSGGQLLMFFNTHQKDRAFYRKKVYEILAEKKLKYQIIKEFGLGGDCPTQKGFPEGNYLKGFLLKKN